MRPLSLPERVRACSFTRHHAVALRLATGMERRHEDETTRKEGKTAREQTGNETKRKRKQKREAARQASTTSSARCPAHANANGLLARLQL